MDDSIRGADVPIDAVCAAFGLGSPLVPMTRMPGGMAHTLWRLETDRGRFAIKQINRNWQVAHEAAGYERAFQFEKAAGAAGIPIAPPVSHVETGGCLAEIDVGEERPLTFRAHEWVESTMLREDACGPREAYTVGGMLAGIHALRVAAGMPARQPAVDPAHWRSLLDRGAAEDWHDGLGAILPAVDELIALATLPGDGHVMSHRDCDAKNVLRTPDGALVLIDWDTAGPTVPREDVAMHAIMWGGGYARDPDAASARAFLAGYREAGGDFDAARREDFAEFMRVMLRSFAFNLGRTLGDRLADETHLVIARRQVAHLLGALPRFARSVDAWTQMLAAP
jgi:aminoglycoside phosphotransferase (APT) family kinase protein